MNFLVVFLTGWGIMVLRLIEEPAMTKLDVLSAAKLSAKLHSLEFKQMDRFDYYAYAGAPDNSEICYVGETEVWMKLPANSEEPRAVIQHYLYSEDGELLDYVTYDAETFQLIDQYAE